jgi:hypothetical protein
MMRTLGINTREDPLDPGAETADRSALRAEAIGPLLVAGPLAGVAGRFLGPGAAAHQLAYRRGLGDQLGR